MLIPFFYFFYFYFLFFYSFCFAKRIPEGIRLVVPTKVWEKVVVPVRGKSGNTVDQSYKIVSVMQYEIGSKPRYVTYRVSDIEADLPNWMRYDGEEVRVMLPTRSCPYVLIGNRHRLQLAIIIPSPLPSSLTLGYVRVMHFHLHMN
jgi:hypothetical protein